MEHPLAVPGLTPDEQDVLSANLTQLNAKRSRNLLRAGLYDGKHAVRQVGSIIPPTYYQTAVVLGWPAKAVDLLARRCSVDGWDWSRGDLADAGISEIEEANALGSELNQAFTSALLHSVSFLVATRGMDGEAKAMVHARDALSATGIWSPRSRRLSSALTVSEFESEVAGGKPSAFTLYLDGVTVTTQRRAGRWTVERSEHRYGVPVEPLVYKPRLGRPFGSSRISRPVISAYRQAVRTAIRMEGGADVFAFPQMVLLGADSSVFKDADGSMRPAWQVALGRVFALPDDEDATNPRAQVQRFEGASPEPHLKMLRQQAELFSGETSIPITSLGVSTDGNPTSAESYIASREDLISEAEGTGDDFSPALSRTMARLLAIQNDGDVEDFTGAVPRFRSPIYTSRAAAADAGAKQIASVPWLADTEVGLELLGLSPAQIKRALADKRRIVGRGVLDALRSQAGSDALTAPGDVTGG